VSQSIDTVEPPTSPGRRLSRSQRSTLIQWAIVLAGLGVVAAVLVPTVAWGALRDSFLDPDIFRNQFPDIITEGVKNTLVYTAISFVGGVVLGLIAALMRQSKVTPARILARVYVDFFRSIPALMTILLVGFGVPIAFRDYDLPGFFNSIYGKGCLALALVSGAYIAETIRAGIEAIPKGQTEAARSLGMKVSTTYRYVILPQAFRIVIPPMANEFILLLKDTSLLAILGVAVGERELTTFGRLISNRVANPTPLAAAAVMYLVITVPLTILLNVLQKRQRTRER
jgi:polar amino acid transport system permease protein